VFLHGEREENVEEALEEQAKTAIGLYLLFKEYTRPSKT